MDVRIQNCQAGIHAPKEYAPSTPNNRRQTLQQIFQHEFLNEKFEILLHTFS